MLIVGGMEAFTIGHVSWFVDRLTNETIKVGVRTWDDAMNIMAVEMWDFRSLFSQECDLLRAHFDVTMERRIEQDRLGEI